MGITSTIAIVLILPLFFISEPYRLSILIFILLNIVFAMSMRLIMTTEQITLHAAAYRFNTLITHTEHLSRLCLPSLDSQDD